MTKDHTAQPPPPLVRLRDITAELHGILGKLISADGQQQAVCELTHQTAGEEDACEQRRLATQQTITEAFTGAQEVIESVRQAVFIADALDVTEWQRGYRACAELVVATLDQWETDQPSTITER